MYFSSLRGERPEKKVQVNPETSKGFGPAESGIEVEFR